MIYRRLLVVLCLFLLAATASAQTKKNSKGLLPKSHKDLWFGMPMAAFGEARPFDKDSLGTSMDFRRTLVERQAADNAPGLHWAVYYFDAEDDFPLYEIILEYGHEGLRDEAAKKLLGEPNAGDEWYFPNHKGFPFRAWLYQNKLILAAAIPGSEWEGEWEE